MMKMECIETRALKSSVLSQMAVKPNSQVFNYNDDVWCLAGINNDDNFPVEDLLNLDFPEKDLQEGCFSQADDEEKVSLERNSNYSSTTFSVAADEFDTLSAAGELAVPADDLENLEWLSQFVDDSTAGLSLLCPVGSFTASSGVNPGKRIETLRRPVQEMRVPFLRSPVPIRARSKRATRPSGRRPWYLASPPSSAVESSTTTSSNGSSALPAPWFARPVVFEPDWYHGVEKPPAKKHKKSPEADSGRRCTHCQVNKTPQWRTGPLGPKTLCNACGVRYKSGRLFPEYRPACSPTFAKEVHSNSHRKVLEMRRKKEMVVEPGSA